MDTHETQLEALLAAGGGYEYLNAAVPHLEREPANDHLRLMCAREYLRLGLGGPARELLSGATSALLNRPDYAQLLQAAALATGRQSWVRQAARFDGNLAALSARGIDVQPLREAWSRVRSSLELYTDSNGASQLRVRSGRVQRWLPRLANHRQSAAAAPLPTDHKELMPGPYLFDGVDPGGFLERVWRGSRNTFLGYDAAIYVFEPDPAALAIVLHLHDWQELLADPAVMLFVGPGCCERLQETLAADPDLPLPRFVFAAAGFRGIFAPASTENQKAVRETPLAIVRRLTEQRAATLACSFGDIEQRYAERDAAYWARRFAQALSGEGPPLRILASVSTHTTFLQYSMRDALRAFEQLGCQTRLLIESRSFEVISHDTYHRQVRELEPDLLFVIDHLRASLGDRLPTNLPILTWDQDALPHLFNDQSVARMAPIDAVVGVPHFELLGRGAGDPRAFLTAHMAASPEQFDSSELTEADLAPYRCDVSYVSHASQTPQAFHEEERAAYGDEKARRLLDAIFPLAVEQVQRHGAIGGTIMHALLEQGEQRAGVRVVDPTVRHRMLGWYIWRLCDRVFRHQALEWAAAWAETTGRTLRIHGNGWDKHPTLARFAAGPAQNGKELLCVYRASAINLQLMPAGFLHQRSLDGVLANGFFLARETLADRRNPRLPLLAKAIAAGGWRSGVELRRSANAETLALFEQVRAHLGYAENAAEPAFHYMVCDAARDYADEVFADFAAVTFRDPPSFAQAAERFLAAPQQRSRIAACWRQTVIERYSYRAMMQRFLEFMRDSLAARARRPPESNDDLGVYRSDFNLRAEVRQGGADGHV